LNSKDIGYHVELQVASDVIVRTNGTDELGSAETADIITEEDPSVGITAEKYVVNRLADLRATVADPKIPPINEK
jgi:hypothetical protein